MDLAAILQTLESKKTKLEDKVDAYVALSSHLKDGEVSLDVTKQADRVLTVLKRDVQSEVNEVRLGSLEVLGFCLHDTEIVRCLSATSASQLLAVLRQCVESSEDKVSVTRSLCCLSKQKLPTGVVQEQIPALLDALERVFSKWRGQSTIIEYEALSAVSRFVDQVPVEMKSRCSKWGRLVVPLLVHAAVKLRESALILVEATLNWMKSSKDLKQSLVPEFKNRLCAEMKKMFVKNEVFTLSVWKLSVTLLGEALHHGSFINHMLPIAELGFKHSSPEIKIAAFRSWKCLIDNFALNPNILGDQKRIKLIMQVFKINNAKVESVAMEKLQIWWHFATVLGVKLVQNFDQVVVPLLHFCLGGGSTRPRLDPATPTTPRMALKNVHSPATPRLNLAIGSPGLQRMSFPKLQMQGCHVLAHVLACPSKLANLPHISNALDSLSCELITGTTMFLKHAPAVIPCGVDMICAQAANIPDPLLMYIWQCLLQHLRAAIESSSKSENRDALSTFLVHFQTLVFSQTLPSKTVLKLFQPVCNLPSRALSSTAYNINSGEVVRGTPALFLLEVLLAPTLLKDLATCEIYISLFSTLMNCGTSAMAGSLEFCQAVSDVITRGADFFTNPESVWRLWSILANNLQEHIVKTNEVNQGDSLEYNFDCMYSTLLLPIKHQLGSKLSQPVCKSLLKTWGELYRSFARLSALVSNAEANIVCEEFCQQVHHSLEEGDMKDAASLDFLAQVCQMVIDSVDFSSLGSSTSLGPGVTASPSKWMKRKHKPMENLHSFIRILSHLLSDLAVLVEGGETTVMSKQKSASGCASCLVDVLETLFTHITVSTIIARVLSHLAAPIAWMYAAASKKTYNKLFNALFMQKLEKLWLDICTCVQSRYNMVYDTEFLECVAPLLRDTLLHPRRQIKNQSLLLWKSTFSHAASLTYPEHLIPVLLLVKEKTPIHLPGWTQPSDSVVIEETPFSQYSQMGSFAPDAHLPGMPSPRKIVGSFMNKAVSPNIKKSPAKPALPEVPRVNTARKKLSVNDFRDEDFVVIQMSPKKKKRILTEHQRDVMKERRNLPAMYSNLDQSQDVSLMSQFNTDTQEVSQFNTDTRQESIMICSQSPEVIIVNSSQSQAQLGDRSKAVNEPAAKPVAEPVGEVAEEVPELRRGRRRRSVRFSKDEKSDSADTKDDTTDSEGTSSSQPRTTRSSRSRKHMQAVAEEQADPSAEASGEATRRDKPDNKNGDDGTKESDVPSLESVGDSSPSLKQNLMQEIGEQWPSTISSTISSKEASSSSLSKTDSSGEGGEGKETQSSTRDSQPSQEASVKHFSPFKSFSQSPPERKSRSPSRRSLSQDNASGRKSPYKTRGSQAGSLDRWLVKSPAKRKLNEKEIQKLASDVFTPSAQCSYNIVTIVPSSVSTKTTSTSLLHSVMEDTQSPSKHRQTSQTIVEDTQSPSKFSDQLVSPNPKASVGETPVKDPENNTSRDLTGSTRNLFTSDNCTSQDPTQEPAVVIGSLVVTASSPVVAMRKMSDEDIIGLSSPAKVAAKVLFSNPGCTSSLTGLSQGFSTRLYADKPKLDHQLSTGFHGATGTDSQKSNTSDDSFPPILTMDQMADLHNASSSSSAYSVVCTGSMKNSSQDVQSSSAPSITSSQGETVTLSNQPGENFTEDLFATCPEDGENNPVFNPDADSTLREAGADSTPSSKSSSQETQDSVASRGASQESVESFNPDTTATLAQDVSHARKRKQTTPRWKSQDELRRTPRQRKKKRFHDFETEPASASKEKKIENTPVRKVGRPPSAKKRIDMKSSQDIAGGAAETEGKVVKHEGEVEVKEDSEMEKDANEDGQQTVESVTTRRKRRLAESEEQGDDIPLSQIKEAMSTRSQKKIDDEMGTLSEEGMPKLKRTRKSLSSEFTGSQDSDCHNSGTDTDLTCKPRRIQLKSGDDVDQAASTDFTLASEQAVDLSEKSGDTDTDVTDASKVTEDQALQTTKDSDCPSTDVGVGMELDDDHQSLKECSMSSEEMSKECEQTPSARPSQVPVRRSTTKQKIEAARRRSISKQDGHAEAEDSNDASEWEKLVTAKTATKFTELNTVPRDMSESKMPEKVAAESQIDIFGPSQPESKSVFPTLDVSFCKDSPRAEQEQIKGQVDEIISSLASPVLPRPKFSNKKRKRPLVKSQVASPLSVRLRSSRLVLRARTKFGVRSVSKVSTYSLEKIKKRRSKNTQDCDAETVVKKEDDNMENSCEPLDVTECCEPFDKKAHIEPVAETILVEPVAEAETVEPVAEAETVEPQPVIETEHIEPVAETEHSEPVAETEHSESVAETEHIEPVAETEHSEPVAETEHSETADQTESDIWKETDSIDMVPATNDSVMVIDSLSAVDSLGFSEAGDSKPEENSEPTFSGAKPIDETPKKSHEKPKRRPLHIHRGFSDSKILSMSKIRSRNPVANRGMNIVRRSILKQKNALGACSPSKRSRDPEFQPIKVFQFNSPNASPSAGILKKQRFCRDVPANSPSPPSKHRRVSFADPVISGESPHRADLDHPKSKVAAGKQLFALSRHSVLQLARPRKLPEVVAVDSQPSQSQASFHSTQESQLNCRDPVYPDLIGCTESVTKVLPQLTSSVWSRGLGQLVKARNIHTVGDLCRLSEVDIHNLPIRSPKVITVRRVLQELEQHLEVRRSRDVKATEGESSDDERTESGMAKVSSLPSLDAIDEGLETEDKENREESEEQESLPNMEDAMNDLLPGHDGCDLNNSIEIETETAQTGAESCDQIVIQSQPSTDDVSQSEALCQSLPESAVCESSTPTDDKEKLSAQLVETLDALVKNTDSESLKNIRTGELFQLHQNLAHLSNIVVTAMKSRCHSPDHV